jgi:hypothetical protein
VIPRRIFALARCPRRGTRTNRTEQTISGILNRHILYQRYEDAGIQQRYCAILPKR